MRKVLIGLICICLVLTAIVAIAQEESPWKFDLPNVRTLVVYDFEDHTLETGVLSEVLSYKDMVSLEVGYVTPATSVLMINYNLIDLERFGLEYKWAEYIHVRIGPWAGHDFTLDKGHYGLGCSLLELSF